MTRFAAKTTLATKLIFALSLIVLVVKAITLVVNVRSNEAQLRESMTLGADQLSRSITSATWQAMLADRRSDAYEVMNTIARKQGIQRIRMFNKDGVLMFSTSPGERVHLDERAEVCLPCHSPSETKPLVNVGLASRTRVYRAANGVRTIAMITPIYNERSCTEAACHAHPANVAVLGVLDLTLDATRLDSDMRALWNRTALMGLLEILFVGAFLVFFIRRFVEKPIRKLMDGTKRIADMQLDQPIQLSSSVELEQLADSFNTMRERLKAARDENDQFTQQLETKVEQRTAQLRAAQRKLMQADRLASLGQLAASVAHEINNPLSGVLNLSMLMQRILKEDGVPPNRVEEFRRYLASVAKETARVGHIVSDLLAFSRRSSPQITNASLNDIVRTTVTLVHHKLQLANVEVELQLDESIPHISCDASQIQQVVMNLVLNGGEAIHGGGTVTVVTERSEDGKAVVLRVSDTGSGISPEILSRIFDPFFTTKEEGKGVGLGLAVVYGIVEAHGGEIDVTSTVGSGSTFRVVLPVRVRATEPEEALAGATA